MVIKWNLLKMEYLHYGDVAKWHQYLMVMITAVVNNAEPDGDISGMQSLLGGDRIRGMGSVLGGGDRSRLLLNGGQRGMLKI
eukprot:CAMPEP_0170072040 /NCGR_PEP_ID=MMETSP0019_2-20121128/9779_1 /TAXON_ID=98059 /ORGANISM="Dinobryon sp., Strain UTEXLB2267" /LENGTH=81 /DNA_ID=CAMNT_0010280815 /DNA_START=922 /DNA_END=1167 /DNA_ORIENTATION=+